MDCECSKLDCTESTSKKHKSTVLVIVTGGTIAMVKQKSIFGFSESLFAENIREYRDLHDSCYAKSNLDANSPFFVLPQTEDDSIIIFYEIKELLPLLDSTNATVEDWKRFAKEIEKHYCNYDGFVILHGTDTLQYTSSALSFMLENLQKPVIVTGAQISIFGSRSDGRRNFISSIIVAGKYSIPEVCVLFDDKLMRGNRVIKFSTHEYDAFQSYEFPPLARISVKINVDWKNILRAADNQELNVFLDLNSNVSLLRLHPNITLDQVKAACQHPIEGVVLESYGAGNIPDNRPEILQVLIDSVNRGVIIVNTSQCPDSSLMVLYELGEVADQIGLISGSNMTSSAAYTKLCFVLGKTDWDLETKKKIMMQNIRGELLEPTNSVDYLFATVGQVLGCTNSKDSNDRCLEPYLLSKIITNNDLKSLQALKKFNCNLSAKNSDGRTILHSACASGAYKIVQYLINNGVDIDIVDNFNRTPLIDAIQSGHEEIVTILIEAGANINNLNQNYVSELLSNAAINGNLFEIEMLAMAGVNLDLSDTSGRTPLYLACLNNQLEVAEYLINRGCNLEQEDKLGCSPQFIIKLLNLPLGIVGDSS